MSSRVDFEKTIRNMGKLNPRIKLMMDLQKSFRAVHNKYAIYADSEANLHFTDEQRRAMLLNELRLTNVAGAKHEGDINLYTTKHYYYGLAIQKAWKRKVINRKNSSTAMQVER